MNINRIFCIGKNYADHVAELASFDAAQDRPLGHRSDGQCVVFMKPASCVVPAGAPVKLPRNRGEIHHEAELVVRLNGGGRDIPVETAVRHVGDVTLGLDLTLRELQSELKNKGAPWELAKAFDGAAPLGKWTPYRNQDLQALEFTCHVNGELRQRGFTRDMLYPVARQIHILSQTWELFPGDVIFTGTPKGVGPLRPGDVASLNCREIGSFEWRFA